MTEQTANPVVLVTGAAGGIGAAVCSRLDDDGWQVVASDLTPPVQHDGVALDVTSSQSWAEVVAGVLDRHGRVDALVVCRAIK